MENSTVEKNIENNALKIMKGKYGGAFYARYIFDESSGSGWIQMVIEYPTGELAEVTIHKNICEIAKETIPGESIKESTAYTDKRSYSIKRNRNLSYAYGDYEAFNEFERPDMPIPMKTIWEQIVKRYEELPIVRIHCTCTPEEVYKAMLEFGEEKGDFFKDEIGVYLTRNEMEEICAEYNVPFSRIRLNFEAGGLFDKDATTLGYQKSKKIDGKKVNLYHLKKSGIDRSLVAEENGCIEYNEAVENPKKFELPIKGYVLGQFSL